MFVQNISPVLFTIGPFEVRYYGLVYAIGFLVTYLLLHRLAKKGGIKNLDADKADIFMLYAIIGSIVGARVLDFVFYNPSIIFTNPLEILMMWHGGMSFHGGLIGAAIAGLLFCRKYKVSFYKLADFAVLPFAATLIFGRIANFINGELYGTITNVPWAVNFNNEKDALGNLVFRHPSQLYEAAKNMIIFFTLLPLYMKKDAKKLKDGVVFWLFVLMYGVLRFIINFWRDDARWLGLSTGQYLCIAMVIVSMFFIFKINRMQIIKNKSS